MISITFFFHKYHRDTIIVAILNIMDEDDRSENDDNIIDFCRPKRYTAPEKRGTLSYCSNELTTVRQINHLLGSYLEIERSRSHDVDGLI